MQAKAPRIQLLKFTLLENVQLAQKKQAVGRDENLNATIGDLQDRFGDRLDDLGIEIRLGLIPEELALVEQRARCDEPRHRGEFAQTFSNEIHLHATGCQVEVKAPAFRQFHLASHCILQRD